MGKHPLITRAKLLCTHQLDSQTSDQIRTPSFTQVTSSTCPVLWEQSGLWFLCVISLETPTGREGMTKRHPYQKTKIFVPVGASRGDFQQGHWQQLVIRETSL